MMDTTLDLELCGRELSEDELELVCGMGSTRRDLGYSTSVSTSLIFLGGAIAAIASAPFVAGALAAGSIAASGTAIYWALN